MKSEARTAIALFRAATTLVFAVGRGGGISKSANDTATTTASSPSHGHEVPSAPGGPRPAVGIRPFGLPPRNGASTQCEVQN